METANNHESEADERFLNSIVHSGIDAFILGCVDRVGQITYRQAIAEQSARVPD